MTGQDGGMTALATSPVRMETDRIPGRNGGTLLAPCKPGEGWRGAKAVGNRNGGRTVIEAMSRLKGWTRARLAKLADNEDERAYRRSAARLWLHLLDGKLNAGFRDALRLLMDYTDGKPMQRTQVEVKDPRSPAERCADLAEQLQRIGALPSPTPQAPMLDLSPLPPSDWCDGAGI